MCKRTIDRLMQSELTSDGDGVKIRRATARADHRLLDPFLMLDEIVSDEVSDYIGGFPSHPHRGFETVTYMLEGQMRHKDHMGNEGLLTPGSVQWMTAGKGVIHSEMPEQDEGRMHGFQLWINLQANDKMQPASYQEFEPGQIPETDLGSGSIARIIAGELQGIKGPVDGIATRPSFFDIHLKSGTSVDVPTIENHTVFAYIYQGEISVEGDSVAQGQLALFDKGTSVTLTAKTKARCLFLSAEPINEPIVQWGPFVMNTQTEIEQAIQDYRTGSLTA